MCFFKWLKKDPVPFDEGFCDVGDGHEIHYMQFGNKKGIPVLCFHGGPGGSAKARTASGFDLKKFRVILFSQRGCGKSKFKNLLEENTTLNSVKDAYLLLRHLKINAKVVLSGGSFGSTLALLFALEYPQKVRALSLCAIYLARQADTAFPYEEMFRFYPDVKAEFQKLAGTRNIQSFFREKIFSDKYQDIKTALQYYGAYEYQLGDMNPVFNKAPAITDERINGLKIVLTYETNNMFLKENYILKNIDKIKDLPCLIVHNRFDFCCPIDGAWALHKKMRRSTFVINDDYNHSSAKLKSRFVKERNKFFDKYL